MKTQVLSTCASQMIGFTKENHGFGCIGGLSDLPKPPESSRDLPRRLWEAVGSPGKLQEALGAPEMFGWESLGSLGKLWEALGVSW